MNDAGECRGTNDASPDPSLEGSFGPQGEDGFGSQGEGAWTGYGKRATGHGAGGVLDFGFRILD